MVNHHLKKGAENRKSVFAKRTFREREVLQLVAEGHHTKIIANSLHISPKTVLTHRGNIMKKLGLNSTAALTRYALRQGIADL